MTPNDAPKCRRGGCQFGRPLKPRSEGRNYRAEYCSGACAIVHQRANQALRTRGAAEVAEVSRLIDALNARTNPREFIRGLRSKPRDAA
ncbi:hypothetical protein STENM36S_08957 [Streptomyces tendae]